MKCEELIHYLSDYIDNNLDEALRADAEEHLRSCHNCHVVLDSTRKTILIYQSLNRDPMPVSRRDALFNRLQKAFEAREDHPEKTSGNLI